MPWAYSSSTVLRPSVRFRARRSIRGTTTTSPGRSVSRSCFQAGRRMFRPEATSVKMRPSLSPWSVRMRRWVASPLSPPRLGDPDVAEYRGIHVATSPHGNQTPVCLPVSFPESIRIWSGWQSTAGENGGMEKTGVRGLFARECPVGRWCYCCEPRGLLLPLRGRGLRAPIKMS